MEMEIRIGKRKEERKKKKSWRVQNGKYFVEIRRKDQAWFGTRHGMSRAGLPCLAASVVFGSCTHQMVLCVASNLSFTSSASQP
ncbi:hypothetical protein Ct61P_14597 [Colletotrichum tofieldiae]|nr:hypothetical protein Ct61P_14597 [Colletotrichum tofieldiae]